MHRRTDAADAALLRRTAARLRARHGDDPEVRALAALLDLLAAELLHLSPEIRRTAVAGCGRSGPRCYVLRTR